MSGRRVPVREDRVVRDDQGQIPFQIVRNRSRKRIMVKVLPTGVVEVRTPVFVTAEEADDVVLSNADKVREMIQSVEAKAPAATRYETGETIPYMGEPLALEIAHGPVRQPEADIVGSTLRVTIPKGLDEETRQLAIQEGIINWLGERTLDYIKEHFQELSDLVGRYATKVTVKHMKTQWGSCSTRGNISVNARLVMAPVEVINYVLLHELCHLKHPNHSPDFWAALGEVMPEYATHRAWLKANSLRLAV